MKRIILISVAALGIAFGAHAQELTGTLKKVKEANVITIGHRETSTPFSFLDENQRPAGYSIDICLAIVEAVKRRINAPKLQVRYVAVNAQNRLPLVANGTVDMECGVTTNNEERQRQVGFTHNSYITGLSLMTRRGSGLARLSDLKGKAVSVAAGSTNERLIRRFNEEQRLDLNILPAKDTGEAFLLLETGRVDAYASDEILLFAQRSKSKTPSDFDVVGGLLSFEPYSIVIRRGDLDFEKTANDALAALFRSPEYQAMYDKWFKTASLNVPMNAALRQAISSPNNNPAR